MAKIFPTFLIEPLVMQKADEYDDAELTSISISIRIYLSGLKESVMPNLSDDYIASKLWEIIDRMDFVEP